MITDKVKTEASIKDDMELIKVFTTKEIVDAMVSLVEEKYCPAVKGNCKGHDCAMFVIDRPRNDPRYIEATCTFAGKRIVAWVYGEPKDFNPEEF